MLIIKKVYILSEISHGEEWSNNIIVFADYEDAKKALKECYEAVLQDVDDCELLENEFDEDHYFIQVDIEGNDWTTSCCIIEKEVK